MSSRRARAGATVCDLREPVGGHGLRLALELERLDRLDRDRVAHEAEGRLPDQDLARGGGLLEAGGDVDRVAGHERLPGRALSGHDLAGVDPDAQRDPRAEALLELGVQRRQALLHLPGGAHGPQRIVLVRERDAEDRHHRVPDELLHRSAVALDRASHLVEVGEHHLAHALGVDALAQRRRTGHVAEEHGRELAALGRLGVERRRAGVAEARGLGVVLPAFRAPHSPNARAAGRKPVATRS